jgi:hypothetical protein
MRIALCGLSSLLFAWGFAAAQQTPAPTAESIMTRVAANQDNSEAARLHYVYVQHAHVTSRKGKTVMCEEITDVRVTPTDKGYNQKMLKLDGRIRRKGRYVPYTQAPPSKDMPTTGAETGRNDIHISIVDDDDMDIEMVENMRTNLTNDGSKDGVGAGLFPLTTKSQKDYAFQFAGHEWKNGRDCFHLIFTPKQKDDYGWKGDAWIDAAAYQPVVVRTAMARKIPFAVRTLLGTNVPGLGFAVAYAPQPDGVWFPVSFGTEFKLHVLFFLNREILIDAQNRDFEKTHVDSKISGTEQTIP